MKTSASAFYRNPVNPTAENLVPIRLDIEIDGQRYKDAFTWSPFDVMDQHMLARSGLRDAGKAQTQVHRKEGSADAKREKQLSEYWKEPYVSQQAEFRSYEGQDMYTGEKIVPIKLDLRVIIKDQFLWDLNNFESDPEEFARTFCKDMGIEDPEPTIAFAIREQLYEIAIQSVVSARGSRMSKKGRRGADFTPVNKGGATAVDLVKLFGQKYSVIRKRKEWDVFEPIVDLLSNEEVDALEAEEQRNLR